MWRMLQMCASRPFQWGRIQSTSPGSPCTQEHRESTCASVLGRHPIVVRVWHPLLVQHSRPLPYQPQANMTRKICFQIFQRTKHHNAFEPRQVHRYSVINRLALSFGPACPSCQVKLANAANRHVPGSHHQR